MGGRDRGRGEPLWEKGSLSKRGWRNGKRRSRPKRGGPRPRKAKKKKKEKRERRGVWGGVRGPRSMGHGPRIAAPPKEVGAWGGTGGDAEGRGGGSRRRAATNWAAAPSMATDAPAPLRAASLSAKRASRGVRATRVVPSPRGPGRGVPALRLSRPLGHPVPVPIAPLRSTRHARFGRARRRTHALSPHPPRPRAGISSGPGAFLGQGAGRRRAHAPDLPPSAPLHRDLHPPREGKGIPPPRGVPPLPLSPSAPPRPRPRFPNPTRARVRLRVVLVRARSLADPSALDAFRFSIGRIAGERGGASDAARGRDRAASPGRDTARAPARGGRGAAARWPSGAAGRPRLAHLVGHGVAIDLDLFAKRVVTDRLGGHPSRAGRAPQGSAAGSEGEHGGAGAGRGRGTEPGAGNRADAGETGERWRRGGRRSPAKPRSAAK